MTRQDEAEPTTLHNRIKLWLAHSLKLDHAALQAHLGMAIWVVCALIADTLQDIVGTMLWPCTMFGLARAGWL